MCRRRYTATTAPPRSGLAAHEASPRRRRPAGAAPAGPFGPLACREHKVWKGADGGELIARPVEADGCVRSFRAVAQHAVQPERRVLVHVAARRSTLGAHLGHANVLLGGVDGVGADAAATHAGQVGLLHRGQVDKVQVVARRIHEGGSLIEVVQVGALAALKGERVVRRGERGGQLAARRLALERLEVVEEVVRQLGHLAPSSCGTRNQQQRARGWITGHPKSAGLARSRDWGLFKQAASGKQI